jgi:hypothetical protein
MGKGRGNHLPAFLGLPLLKCALIEGIVLIINNVRDPLKIL